MNNKSLLFVLLFITALSFNSAKAQYTKILDFDGIANGKNPNGSLISDGTYLYGMTPEGGANNMGTVFKIQISNNAYTKILDFAGATNGKYPQGSLISDGTYLYGMTNDGGANDKGTVFKIQISNNAYTRILDFEGTTNGSYPVGGSLISDATYLYGMTYKGGANNIGTVFKIQISNNAYTKILDFDVTANGSYPSGSLISDGTYLYGMTYTGGANDFGTAFKVQISNNAYTKILDFVGASNGSYPRGSLISDGTYLYGMTRNGGANDLGTAFKIQISNNAYTKILDFAGTANGSSPYGSLISDGTYLYGMTYQGGANNMGTAFKIQISNNAYTKILDFDGTVNGSYPLYGHFLLNGSYLYGMTYQGGATGLGTVFKFQIYSPEINVKQNTTTILDNTGTYNFGNVNAGTPQTVTFTVENTGTDVLNLTGTPKVVVSGTGFTLDTDAAATVSAAGTTTFKVTFTPNTCGAFSGTISIANDDTDENPYNFAITGTGTDNVAPVANVSTLSDITAECSVTTLTAPTATDNCAGTITGTNNATLPINTQGTTVVTWTYNDGNGNTSTQNQNIIIDDNTAPVVNVSTLSNITAECEVTSLTAPTATDNCAGTITATHNATLPITTQGTTVVIWTYNDGNGNTLTQNQNIIIEDVTAPVPDVETLADVTAECIVTELTAPTATDNCSGEVTVTNDVTLPIATQGTTIVTWTYDDGNGNTSTQSQNIVIEDQTDPTIDCGDDIIINLLEGETFYTVLGGELDPVGANDNCGISTGYNDYNNDVSLEGEELPIGVHNVLWTVVDGGGNTASCTKVITVNEYISISENNISFNIYPNPTTGRFTISNQQSEIETITIIDATGKTLEIYQINSTSYQFDLTNLSEGIYFIRIQTLGSVQVEKIILK